jgi:predicted RNA-binding Zn-ribbon protein involved in translation (DUF1610 family)
LNKEAKLTSSSVVALKCPGCGAALQVDQQAETHACRYCGVTLRVDHAQGAISLRLVADAVASVQRGTDRTAAELAIRRLSEDLKGLEREQTQLRSDWDDEIAAWSKSARLAAQTKVPGQSLVEMFVAIFAFFLVFSVFGALSMSFPAEFHGLLLLLSFAGAIFVAKLVGNRSPSLLYASRRRQAVAEIEKQRDVALAAQETQERELQERINRMKKRLQANLLIADS